MSHVWNQTGECYLVACSFIAGDQVCYWAYHTTSSLQQCEKWLPLPSFALRVPIYLLYLSFPFAPTYLVTFWVMSVYPFFCVSMAISSPFSLSPIVPIYVRKWECQRVWGRPSFVFGSAVMVWTRKLHESTFDTLSLYQPGCCWGVCTTTVFAVSC